MLYYGLVGHVASSHFLTVSLPAGKSLRFLRYVFISSDRVLSDKELAGFHADEHWAGHGGDKQVRDDFIQKLIEDYQFYKP